MNDNGEVGCLIIILIVILLFCFGPCRKETKSEKELERIRMILLIENDLTLRDVDYMIEE